MHLNFLKVKKYKLETYSEMIKQSVENWWVGIFKLKENSEQTQKVSDKAEKEKDARLKRLEEYKKQNWK
jgi:hypothetical protein